MLTAPLKLKLLKHTRALTSYGLNLFSTDQGNIKDSDFMRAVREKARIEKERLEKSMEFYQKVRQDSAKSTGGLRFIPRASS
jgi:hypothetical protein